MGLGSVALNTFKKIVRTTKRSVLSVRDWYEGFERSGVQYAPNRILNTDLTIILGQRVMGVTPTSSPSSGPRLRALSDTNLTAAGSAFRTFHSTNSTSCDIEEPEDHAQNALAPSSPLTVVPTSQSAHLPQGACLRILPDISICSSPHNISELDEGRPSAAVSVKIVDQDDLASQRSVDESQRRSGMIEHDDAWSIIEAVLAPREPVISVESGSTIGSIVGQPGSEFSSSTEMRMAQTDIGSVNGEDGSIDHGPSSTLLMKKKTTPMAKLMNSLQQKANEHKRLYQNMSVEYRNLEHERDDVRNQNVVLAQLVKELEQTIRQNTIEKTELEMAKQRLEVDKELLVSRLEGLEAALHRELSGAENLAQTLESASVYTQGLEQQIKTLAEAESYAQCTIQQLEAGSNLGH